MDGQLGGVGAMYLIFLVSENDEEAYFAGTYRQEFLNLLVSNFMRMTPFVLRMLFHMCVCRQSVCVCVVVVFEAI